MADLVVADLAGDGPQNTALGGEEVAGLEVAVAGERADGEVVAGVAHVGEVGEPSDVDEHGGGGEAQLHERQEGHPAGEELGVVAVLGEGGERLVGRAGPHVLERGGDHRRASAAASTARTMLW